MFRDFIIELAERDIYVSEVLMNLPQTAYEFVDVFIGYLNRYESYLRLASAPTTETQAMSSEAVLSGTRSEYSSVLSSDMVSLLPRIHCYAFSTADDPIYDVVLRLANILQCDVSDMNYHKEYNYNHGESSPKILPRDACWGHIVRDVSPKKMMVCITFLLPFKVSISQLYITE